MLPGPSSPATRPLHLTYQYKLLPTRAQHTALEGYLESQRLLYNAALHARRVAWYLEQRHVETMDQWKSLARKTGDDATARNAMAFWTLTRVEKTFRSVYADESGLPRFKPSSRWNSFGFSGFKGVDLTTKGPLKAALAIQGMRSGIAIHLHRPLPQAATPRAAILTRGIKGWTLSIQFAIADRAGRHPRAEAAIGVDLGVLRLATLSDGTRIDNSKFGAAAATELRVAYQRISRRKKASRRREKAIQHLQRLSRRTLNRRRTEAHQASANITASYGVIAVEKLAIQPMIRSAKPGKASRLNAGLKKAIFDAGLGRLRSYLIYKAERAGGRVIDVNPRGTSIRCSACGTDVPKTLRQRTHRCACGCVMDRDENAARNILQAADAVVRLGSVNARRNAA